MPAHECFVSIQPMPLAVLYPLIQQFPGEMVRHRSVAIKNSIKFDAEQQLGWDYILKLLMQLTWCMVIQFCGSTERRCRAMAVVR